jgi:hypothetical protein
VGDLSAAWIGAMRCGDFEAAWRIGDQLIAARPPGATCWERPRHEQWVWSGAVLDNKRVLVRCYHGLGDTLQFARFLPRLANVAHEVTVWAQPWLIPLLQTMELPAQCRFLPLHDGDPGVDYDVDIEIMELAHAFRISLADVARVATPYLRVAPAERLSSALSVGIVTESGGWDTARSMPRSMANFVVDGVELFDLQLGAEPLPGTRRAGERDALALAARVRSMDLVISVDTMMAHLAGALGVATWLLLPYAADWRWMCDRTDSPWYPTMRIFRQPALGDWRPVLDAVREALQCAR